MQVLVIVQFVAPNVVGILDVRRDNFWCQTEVTGDVSSALRDICKYIYTVENNHKAIFIVITTMSLSLMKLKVTRKFLMIVSLPPF
jgi:hypothetical protein